MAIMNTLAYPFAPPKINRKHTMSVKEVLMGEHYGWLRR